VDNTIDIYRALGPVVAAFEKLRIRNYTGGSVASSLHGANRSTMDADLAIEIDEPTAVQLLQMLETDYYVSETAVRQAVRQRSCFNLIHFDTSCKIDLFVSKDRPFDRSVQDRAEPITVDEVTSLILRVATVEDIILLKLEWYRLGNEQSERQWDDVTRLAKFHGTRLDRAYLDHWATELAVADLAERLLKQVGP
jgi:hypothetical protein